MSQSIYLRFFNILIHQLGFVTHHQSSFEIIKSNIIKHCCTWGCVQFIISFLCRHQPQSLSTDDMLDHRQPSGVKLPAMIMIYNQRYRAFHSCKQMTNSQRDYITRPVGMYSLCVRVIKHIKKWGMSSWRNWFNFGQTGHIDLDVVLDKLKMVNICYKCDWNEWISTGTPEEGC